MDRLATFVTDRPRLAWLLALLGIVTAALGAGYAWRMALEARSLGSLQIETSRRGIEILSATLNGKIMGSLGLLGLIEEDTKLDALGVLAVNDPRLRSLLESIGRSHGLDGVFVVSANGIIRSSWDASGRPSTGLDVRFRPYYRIAMEGRDNVYAAVSLARGDRSLYFSTPIRDSNADSGRPMGALVGRSSLHNLDALMAIQGGMSFLLSPQGLVFASSRGDWVGYLAEAASPERLQAIRELRQFGAMFEGRDPPVLPLGLRPGVVAFEGRRYALATAAVGWNDPSGEWQLAVMQDLEPTAGGEPVLVGIAAGLTLLVVSLLALKVLRGHHAHQLATRRIAAYAREQEAEVEAKSRLAETALRLQRAKTIAELGGCFLTDAHRLSGMLHGLLYVYPEEGAPNLLLASSFACGPDVPVVLEPGTGLTGQSAADGQLRVVDDADAAGWLVRSGLGQARPARVMIVPLILDEEVLGVVEIAMLQAPDPLVTQLLRDMTALLSLSLGILRQHSPMRAEPAEAV